MFPRKTCWARRPADEEGEPGHELPVEERLRSLEREGFKGELRKAIYLGIPGAYGRIPIALRSRSGWVTTYRGMPTILRSTKFRDMVERTRLATSFGHYFDRLAFECASAVRRSEGS